MGSLGKVQTQVIRSRYHDLPVLGNVERPLEDQVVVVVVIEEAGDGVVVTPRQHTGGSFLLVDYSSQYIQGPHSRCVFHERHG